MYIRHTCMKCHIERGSSDGIEYETVIDESGIYQFTCENNHDVTVTVDHERFEILFHIATRAILDGYHREAVASFAAALERFYEYYVRVICTKRGIEDKVLESAWKPVSNQSERQLGAYAFSYLLENCAVAPVLSEGDVKFRNKVIHKGLIPSRSKAIGFGDTVHQIIAPVLQRLKETDREHMRKVQLKHIIERKEEVQKLGLGRHEHGMGLPLSLSITSDPPEWQVSVADTVKELTADRKAIKWFEQIAEREDAIKSGSPLPDRKYPTAGQ